MQMDSIEKLMFCQPIKQPDPISAIFRIFAQIMVAVYQFYFIVRTIYNTYYFIYAPAPDISSRCRSNIIHPDFYILTPPALQNLSSNDCPVPLQFSHFRKTAGSSFNISAAFKRTGSSQVSATFIRSSGAYGNGI